MEKVIAALWAPDGQTREAFGAGLITTLPQALHEAGARQIRLNLRPAEVTAADALVQQWQAPQQAAVVQFWLPSANALFRSAIDAALTAHALRFHAWLVCESTIIANTSRPPLPGQPTWGWSQASFISFRPDLAPALAVEHWHSHHTRVAIETQSNFEYIQNLIVRPLTEGAPAYGAFVEECFPAEAMSDPAVFFDSVGDAARFETNLATMMDSCHAFLDFARNDIIPTIQHDFAFLDRTASTEIPA